MDGAVVCVKVVLLHIVIPIFFVDPYGASGVAKNERIAYDISLCNDKAIVYDRRWIIIVASIYIDSYRAILRGGYNIFCCSKSRGIK